MTNKKVLFLMLAFPDPRKSSNMYTDMILEFEKNGNDVYVATLEENKEKGTRVEQTMGLNILYVYSGQYFNTSFVKKGITLLKLESSFIKAIKSHFGSIEFDYVIYPTPPITFAGVVKAIKAYSKKTESYLILRDIFPQNAVDLGLIKNKLLTYYFENKERNLYKVSDYIGCMSPGNIDYVLERHPELRPKIHLLPNWKRIKSSKTPLTEEERQSILKKHNLPDGFIALFGGVIGVSQELENLIHLAERVKHIEDASFVIIGEGNQKDELKTIAREKGLKNVHFLEKLPRDEYDKIVLLSDLGLVNLNGRFTIPNIPSKTMDYFEMSIPILACVDKNTDYGQFLLGSGAGKYSVAGDVETYYKNFMYFYESQNHREAAGKEGRRLLENFYSVDKCFHVIADKLEEKNS